MSRQAHEWLKSSAPAANEQGRGGRLPLAGFSGFGRPIDGWYLVTRHVYSASHAPGGLVDVNLLIALLCTAQSSHACNATHIYRLMKPCWQSLHTTKPHPVERSPMSRPGRPKATMTRQTAPKGKVRRDRAGVGHVTKCLSRYVRLWPRKHQNALLHRFDSRRSTACRLCFSTLDMSAKVHAKLSPSDHLPSATTFRVRSHATYFHVLERFPSRSYRSSICPSQKYRSFDGNSFTFK